MSDTMGLDQAKAEAFAGRLAEALNGAAIVAFGSVGHQTGLFDTMAQLPPSTSQQIATAAGLQERYVREWLNGLTAARILDYDPTAERYALPPEHAAFLTRAAGADNFAHMMQYFPLMGRVEPQVVESFQNGGGVGYDAYENFAELQRDESAPMYDQTLVSTVLPLAAGLIQRLEAGIDVLDVGCGGGHAVNVMAQAYPRSRFRGIDFGEESIALAREEAQRLGLSNATFEVADAVDIVGPFDLVTAFDVIHDLAAPDKVLAAIARALRDDGIFLMVDINASSNVEDNLDHPIGPTLYAFSVFHCMTVSLAQGGPGLGTVWGKQLAKQMLESAGLVNVDIKEVEGDIFHAYYVARKSSSKPPSDPAV